ncbi:MAG: ABC transporter ATP-binding protein [Chloroflexi bacterium]|nr:ABC transporter ATP-binding protein [Chloroflexota bacterium]
MTTYTIQTKELSKVYGDGAQVRALDSVDLYVQTGEFVAVMGPSGSGKSTLLHILGALDRPTSGQVIINGRDLATVHNLDHFRAKEIGFVFQLHNLIPTLTARENVEVPMEGVGMPERERRERAEYLLSLVDMADRTDFVPSKLSGGERQRVAIARALANDPALILADEPTGNLDSESGANIVALFDKLNLEENKTILLVTHDPVVALSSQRIITLHDGMVRDDRRVQETYLKQLQEMKGTPLGSLLFHDYQAAGH